MMDAFASSHFRDLVSVADITAAAGLSAGYGATLFRRQTGKTLVGRLTELRVHHAERLLAGTRMTVLEVAMQSGFGSLSRFYEAFTQVTGMRPREVRGPLPTHRSPGTTFHAIWVDDRPLNNVIERRCLAEIGIVVDSYQNNFDALGAMKLAHYHVVVSDIHRDAPAESGWSLLRAVKHIRADIPFFFYTGFVDVPRRRQAQHRGATGMFTRPRQLFDAVLRVVGQT